MSGRVLAISVSDTRGTKKRNITTARLVENHGIQGDAHAGDAIRQVSLLALESIEKARAQGITVEPGDFAENITTSGIDLKLVAPGDRLEIGADAILEITQLGKECHDPCEIGKSMGKCAMPEEGIFARVVVGGNIRVSDSINFVSRSSLKDLD